MVGEGGGVGGEGDREGDIKEEGERGNERERK